MREHFTETVDTMTAYIPFADLDALLADAMPLRAPLAPQGFIAYDVHAARTLALVPGQAISVACPLVLHWSRGTSARIYGVPNAVGLLYPLVIGDGDTAELGFRLEPHRFSAADIGGPIEANRATAASLAVSQNPAVGHLSFSRLFMRYLDLPSRFGRVDQFDSIYALHEVEITGRYLALHARVRPSIEAPPTFVTHR